MVPRGGIEASSGSPMVSANCTVDSVDNHRYDHRLALSSKLQVSLFMTWKAKPLNCSNFRHRRLAAHRCLVVLVLDPFKQVLGCKPGLDVLLGANWSKCDTVSAIDKHRPPCVIVIEGAVLADRVVCAFC